MTRFKLSIFLGLVTLLAVLGAPASIASAQQPPVGPRRLPTGTIVKQDPNWIAGDDNLLIITNNQDSDAVVELDQNQVPMIRVYVQAHDSYTLTSIWHSTFTLSFVLGQDWDSKALAFTSQVRNDHFDQPLVFDRTVGLSDDGYCSIFYSYWKANLGSSAPGDTKTLEELGDHRYCDADYYN